MAHLWYVDRQSSVWSSLPLEAGVVEVGPDLFSPLRRRGGEPEALLLRSQTGAGEHWLLMNLTLRPLAINGERLANGIRILTDKDEIRLADVGRVFFSSERLPRLELFAGSERPLFCPRCRDPLVVSRPIVRCACSVAYHFDAERDRRCFDYGPCTVCNAPTELSETFRWQPGAL